MAQYDDALSATNPAMPRMIHRPLVLLRNAGMPCLLALGTLLLGSCYARSDRGAVIVSAIGGAPTLADAAVEPMNFPSRVLRDATAQGLVRFDATGQIEPGLAERWTVIDDGMSYIFRLRESEWGDGHAVGAGEVVKAIDRQLVRGSRNPAAPFLTAVEDTVEMTPEVIQIHLKRPRPDLLKLFAQPEMAIVRTRRPAGTGPFRIIRRSAHGVTLRPAFDPARLDAEEIAEPGPEQNINLIGERASRALARFVSRQSDLVLGGSYIDWPLVPLAGIAAANIRVDPAAGLFGIGIARRNGFLADAANRAALAEAIDRNAIVAAYAPGWAAAEQILPDQLDSASAAVQPSWQSLSAGERHVAARGQIALWRKTHPGPVNLTLAMPSGPGATILYGFVAAAWRSIGVEVRRVPQGADADLRIIDAVAPYDSARWYLATACAPCSDAAQTLLEAARDATTLNERARLIADADLALSNDVPVIVIARPLRWSLVALRLHAWQPNSRAWHPLNHLRTGN